MATIATLNTNVTATVANFVGGMKSSKAAAADFGSSISSLKGLLAGLGVTLSGAAFVAFTKHAADAIDTTAKVSDRLGISTEALTGLRHAANLAGTDVESFDALLTKMTVNIGKAVTEGGPAAEAFSDIGLSAQELAAAKPEEAFKQISDAISGLVNPAERAKAAVDIFGKSGATLLPTLLSGRAGLDAMALEADKLGLSLSRVEASQVEAANDAISRVGEAIQGVGQRIAIELAPFVEAVAKSLTDAATAGEGMGAKVKTAAEYAVVGFGKVLDVVQTLKLAFDELQHYVTMTIDGWVFLISLIPGTGDALKDYLQELDNTLAEQEKMLQKAWVAPEWSKQFKAEMDKIAAASKQAADAVAAAAPGGGASDENNKASIKTALDAMKEVDSILNSLETPLGRAMDTFGKLGTLLAEGAISWEKYQEAAAAVKKQLGDATFNQFASKQEKLTKQLQDLIQLRDIGVFDNNPDAFHRAILGATKEFRGTSTVGNPTAIEKGSAAAIALQASARNEARRNPLEEIALKQFGVAQDQLNALNAIKGNIKMEPAPAF